MLAQQFNAFHGDEHLPFILNGGKPAALLIHGFPGTPAEMRPIAQLLYNAGWTVQALLLPGFGPEVETLAERTADDWAGAVKQAYIELRTTHTCVMLIGFSMGGALAIRVAAEANHRPDGLILLAPFWRIEHFAWRLLPVIKIAFPQPRLFKWIPLDFKKADVRDGIHNFLPDADLDDPEVQQAIRDFKVPIKMFAQIHAAGKYANRLAPNLTSPTLVLQGKQDELVKPHLTRQLIQQFQGTMTYNEVNGEHEINNPDKGDWQAVQHHILNFASKFYSKTETTGESN